MYDKINEKFLIRQEFFGGVVINKDNMCRQELNRGEATYLYALRKTCGNIELSEKVVKELTGCTVETKRLFDYSIIQRKEGGVDEKIDYYKIKNEMEEELIPIWKSTNKHLSAPLEITIYPTLNCNLKCKFCFVKNKNKASCIL